MNPTKKSPVARIFAKFGVNLPPRPTVPQTHEPSKGSLTLLTIVIAIALAWHFSIAQPIIAAFSIVPLLLKIAYLRRSQRTASKHQPAPSRWVMALLTAISLGLILVFYGGWNGQVAGISFIVLLVSLKFLESRSLRDYFLVCVILYFLAACAFLFDSSIISIAGVALYVVAITAALHLLSTPETVAAKPVLKSSARLLATALPIAIILFFFFPRIQGDFGFLPSRDESNDSQALDDRLIAGDFALSAFNNALAFRAEFEGQIPAPHERYWRVKALTGERNFQWEIAPDIPWQENQQTITGQKALLAKGFYNYTIIHQESTDPYLPYLDYLRGFSDGLLLENTVVRLRSNRSGTFAYSGSADRTRTFKMPVNKLGDRYTQTIATPSPQMNAQLQKWRSAASNNAELAGLVMNHFRENPFSYTLIPPILDEQRPLEDFFFNTQSGYCEHYASAFTTIMRWLDVPARVVVGYQGGELNTSGAFVEVRYSDAHAWTEVWINNAWQRYDPTAAISPDRIEFGMQALMEMWDGYQFSDQSRGRALANFLNPQGVGAAYRLLRQSWSNVSYQWNKWIVNYDVNVQRELLNSLGLSGFKTLNTLLVLLISGLAGIAILQLLPSLLSRETKPKEKLLLDRLVKKLSRKGLVIAPNMTARDIAALVVQQSPNQSKQINAIVHTYELLRYADNSELIRAKLLQRLRDQIKRFSIQSSQQVVSQNLLLKKHR